MSRPQSSFLKVFCLLIRRFHGQLFLFPPSQGKEMKASVVFIPQSQTHFLAFFWAWPFFYSPPFTSQKKTKLLRFSLFFKIQVLTHSLPPAAALKRLCPARSPSAGTWRRARRRHFRGDGSNLEEGTQKRRLEIVLQGERESKISAPMVRLLGGPPPESSQVLYQHWEDRERGISSKVF